MIVFSEQLNYMYGLERFGIRLGLDVMKKLLAALSDPQLQLKSVHIGGTNGKGSTAAMVASILQEGGYKTGLYTSPHLVRFNERIAIDGQEISELELSVLVDEVRTASARAEVAPTFFEFTTALAFLYLARKKVDIAVVEVGLGGDLDATNVIQPLLAVITNIGYDHMEILGKEKQEIAAHKAGIIKQQSVVVTGEEDEKLVEYFRSIAAERGAKFVRARDRVRLVPKQASLSGQTFEAQGQITGTFELPLLGEHQLKNAAVALAALGELGQQGFEVGVSAMQRGLAATKWSGRLQVLSREPLVMVDGAHNEEGARALEQFLAQSLPKVNAQVLVLAIKSDKQIPTMLTKIVPRFKKVIVTEGSYEPMAASDLGKLVKKYHKNVLIVPQAAQAVAAGRVGLTKNDFMLATGSLYMIGEALKAWQENVNVD